MNVSSTLPDAVLNQQNMYVHLALYKCAYCNLLVFTIIVTISIGRMVNGTRINVTTVIKILASQSNEML